MNRFLLCAHTLLCLAVAAMPRLAGAAEPLRLLTEPYPGYSFEENGTIRGASADQVHLMMRDAKVNYHMEIMPWARAYKLAVSSPNTCIFATNHTEERDLLFQWVEPLGGGRMVLIRKAGSGIAPANLEEAKAFMVGVQRGDYAETWLLKKGFTRLDRASDFGLTLKKLTSGRIDLAMTSDAAYQAALAQGEPLDVVQDMPAAMFALACSHDVPPATLARLQDVLNRLILDGTQDKLYQKYGMPAQNMGSFIKKTN